MAVDVEPRRPLSLRSLALAPPFPPTPALLASLTPTTARVLNRLAGWLRFHLPLDALEAIAVSLSSSYIKTIQSIQFQWLLKWTAGPEVPSHHLGRHIDHLPRNRLPPESLVGLVPEFE